ncbi:hypothetical protein [Nitrosopumilus sp. b2]|uniref:hypothetical protein n=1 Tax=Nitrosopumilus sp. b2 TaxID=2109908 RepID=UPI0015F43E29|nr:hypothetical protein [Nitrosopumilus sp. b2]
MKFRLKKITLAQAARESNVTMIEMMEYLINTGYRSSYSIVDFKKSRKNLKPFLKESHKKPKKYTR